MLKMIGATVFHANKVQILDSIKKVDEKLVRYEIKKWKNECRKKTNMLVRKGILIKEPCDVCGEVKVDAHHPDYNDPEMILWLCRWHHSRLHKYMNLAN